MKIWLPYVFGGSGSDVFTQNLAIALRRLGHKVTETRFSHNWQYFPAPMRHFAAPKDVDVAVCNSWNGFAFKRSARKLVIVEHHCVHDPAYAPYRSTSQALFHNALVRPYELASLKAADALVTCSRYTAESTRSALGGPAATVILNGIDTEYFCPEPGAVTGPHDAPVKLLFVGNLIRRKGADLLPKIMERLGSGFELAFTSGLRTPQSMSGHANMKPLGKLTRDELRAAYRQADMVLFPSRFEGFGYAAAEAMACGTPVVTTRASSLPEVVDDGVTGRLCAIDDVNEFVSAVVELSKDASTLQRMGRTARDVAVSRFSLGTMAKKYEAVFEGLMVSAQKAA